MIKCPICDNTTEFSGTATATATDVSVILDGEDFYLERRDETVMQGKLTSVTCLSCKHTGSPFLFGIGELPKKAICIHEKSEIGELYRGIVFFTTGTAMEAVETFLDEEIDRGGSFDWFFMDVEIAEQIEREVDLPEPRIAVEHELEWIQRTALLMCQAFSIEDPDEDID